MRQWLCKCGKWIDDAYSTHTHIKMAEPDFSQMHSMRRAQESGLTGVVPDYFNQYADVDRYFRSGKEPVRHKPL